MYENINLIGLIMWPILFFVLVPYKLILKNPLILVGLVYVLIVLYFNYKKLKSKRKYSDLNTNVFRLVEIINTKAVHVATAIFALALATKDIFKKPFDKEILRFIIYTLIFGVGMIIPIYFISNDDYEKFEKSNKNLIVLRNVFLSYSIGFMTSAFFLVLNKYILSDNNN